jgi:hypothetical protein
MKYSVTDLLQATPKDHFSIRDVEELVLQKFGDDEPNTKMLMNKLHIMNKMFLSKDDLNEVYRYMETTDKKLFEWDGFRPDTLHYLRSAYTINVQDKLVDETKPEIIKVEEQIIPGQIDEPDEISKEISEIFSDYETDVDVTRIPLKDLEKLHPNSPIIDTSRDAMRKRHEKEKLLEYFKTFMGNFNKLLEEYKSKDV